MAQPKDSFERVRPLDFRTPDEVLEPDMMYSIYEIARLLQGVDPDRELNIETESILLDWAIPWMMLNADRFVFAEPTSADEPGYYGLA